MANCHFIAIALAACSASAFADEPITVANNELSLLIGVRDQVYHELDNYHQRGGEYLDSESGVQLAIRAAVSRQGPLFGIDDVYSAAALTVATGHTSYDGFAISQASPNGIGAPMQQNKIGATADIDLKVGRAFRVFDPQRFQVTPYIAYEYHRWVRDSLETYSNHMIGAGLLMQYAITPKLVIDADVGIGRTLGAQVQSRHGVDEQLGSRFIRSASMGLDYATSERVHILASYQIKSFSYGQSKAVEGTYDGVYGSWYEPTSRTREQTFLVGVAYAF